VGLPVNKINLRVPGKLGIQPQQSSMGIDYFSVALLADPKTVAASPDHSHGHHEEDTLAPPLILACQVWLPLLARTILLGASRVHC
jgi:hypothetical protein